MGKEYVGKAMYFSLFFERVWGLMAGERMSALLWSSGHVC